MGTYDVLQAPFQFALLKAVPVATEEIVVDPATTLKLPLPLSVLDFMLKTIPVIL